MDQLDHQTSASASDSSPKNDKLKLNDGGSAADVYVKPFTVSGTKVAGFAKRENGNYHTKGITWKSTGSSLSVTFHLLGDVASLSAAPGSAVTFSAVTNQTQTATFPDEAVSEPFTVNFSDGSHDPQIIISPG